MARALPDYGKVVSLERDMQMAALARLYLARDPAGAKVEVLLGDAHDTLPGLREIFDVIFIDADKAGYPGYFDLALDRLRKTGLIVIDNLLMNGRVAAPATATTTGRRPRSRRPWRSIGASPLTRRSTTCCCRWATAWGSCSADSRERGGPQAQRRSPTGTLGSERAVRRRRLREDP